MGTVFSRWHFETFFLLFTKQVFAIQTAGMKCQILLSRKNKKKYIIISAEFFYSACNVITNFSFSIFWFVYINRRCSLLSTAPPRRIRGSQHWWWLCRGGGGAHPGGQAPPGVCRCCVLRVLPTDIYSAWDVYYLPISPVVVAVAVVVVFIVF